MKPLRCAALALTVAAGVSLGCAAQQTAPAAPSEFKVMGNTGIEYGSFVYDSASGNRLHVFRPAKGAPKGRAALLLVHGGGWRMGQVEWTFDGASRLARQGYIAVAVQYRLAVPPVTPVEQIDDLCRAFRYVRQRSRDWGIDASKVGGMGWSAGGHLAAETALRGCATIAGPQLLGGRGLGGSDALVLWSPALDTTVFPGFESLLLGRAKAYELSPVHTVYFQPPPTLILHGEADAATPAETGRQFCIAAKKHNGQCEVHSYPGLGHMLAKNLSDQFSSYDPDIQAVEDGWQRVYTFLARLWGKPLT